MSIQNMFLLIIITCLFLIVYEHNYEKFISNLDNESGLNLYFAPIKNIFLTDDYNNYNLNKPKNKQETQSLSEITFNTYLYSKPTTQKIICSSHTNRANCWEDNTNNCQWVYKIDGNSYCDVGLNLWP